MKKLIYLLLMFSFLFAGSFINGNKLYNVGLENYKIQLGDRGNWIDSGFYMGYVEGVFDSYNKVLFCSPLNITSGQVHDIIFKYLQNHPEIRNLPANLIILKALKKIWPCKNK
jgi:hypothetical protein